MWLELQLKIQVSDLVKAKVADQSQTGKIQGKIPHTAGKNQSTEQAQEAEINKKNAIGG